MQVDPSSVKAAFQQRAEESGGKLFGCWRSMIGLGIGRDEGIAMTAWPDESSARAAAAPGAPVTDCERQILNATVRPVTDDAPTMKVSMCSAGLMSPSQNGKFSVICRTPHGPRWNPHSTPTFAVSGDMRTPPRRIARPCC